MILTISSFLSSPLLLYHNSPGSKAVSGEFSNSMYDLGTPIGTGPLKVIQLAEDLKLALELQPNQKERDSLRAQLHTETAQALVDWLQSGIVSTFASFDILSNFNIQICFLKCSVYKPSCSQVNGNVKLNLSVSYQAVSQCVFVLFFLFNPNQSFMG